MTSRRTGSLLLVAAFAAASFAASDAPKIEMLLPGEHVASRFRSSGDRRTFAYAGIAGSTLEIASAAAEGARVIPTISVIRPDGSTLDVGATNPNSKGRAHVAAFPLDATGVWRIVVATPPSHGGAYVLATKAVVQRTFDWTGSAGAPRPQFAAAPGGRVDVTVAAAAFTPSFDLVAPSGAVLAHVKGALGRAASRIALPELGDYSIRVTGGSGPFAARAVVHPARKRHVPWREVEAGPLVRGYSPTATSNQLALTLAFDGADFSDDQTVEIAGDAGVVATGHVTTLTADSASAVVDLAEVPPGTYAVRVATPSGRETVATSPLVVTNRTPGVAVVDPAEAANANDFPLEVVGTGFDAGASLFVRRIADGTLVPVAVTARQGHEVIEAVVSPPARLTGPCEIEVRDPDGKRGVLAALDLLGYSADPVAVRTFTGPTATDFQVDGAAYDATHRRVLVAMREEHARAVFVLYDLATRAVVDTLTIAASDLGGGRLEPTRVAWDGVGGTFALGLASSKNPSWGSVRVVSATDVHHVVAEADLASAGTTFVTRVDVAADRGAGGYLVVWDQLDPVYGARIRAQPIAAGASIDASARTTLTTDASGGLGFPAAVWQRSGRFVVAWAGYSDDGLSFAVHATVATSAGVQVAGHGPYVTATSGTWGFVEAPELALDPEDGGVLLAFSYAEGFKFRPAAQRLAPDTAYPDFFAPLDAGMPITGGVLTGLAWNPARREFVATFVGYDDRVAVRRIDPDGAPRPAPVVESYEGTSGALWVGAAAGTLGLARGFDGVADDVHDAATTTMKAVVGPIR